MTSDDLDSASGAPGRFRAEVARLTAELHASQQRETTLQDQLTGTASILRAIASGPNDASAVLQSIVEAVTSIVVTGTAALFRVDGNEIERMANLEGSAWGLPVGQRMPIVHGSWAGRAILERRTIRHDDADAIVDQEYPATAASYRARVASQGPDAPLARSIVILPLLREGRAIGALTTARTEIRPFTDDEVALLETFADQAVIAIENARLFTELQASNRQTTEALDQQT